MMGNPLDQVDALVEHVKDMKTFTDFIEELRATHDCDMEDGRCHCPFSFFKEAWDQMIKAKKLERQYGNI